MILIADSGSTKCDWQAVKDKQPFLFTHTNGINPFFHDEITIEAFIIENEKLTGIADEVTHIFFYCAGGSNSDLNIRVERGLKKVFKNAEIMVDHDLVGAALSTWNGHPGITCILGTGSNSVYFDGNKMKEEVPALAYILGDEGSGSYFGKKLLADYLYKKLPAEIADVVRYELKLTKNEILDRVYMKPYANVYLAGFMKLIHQFLHLDYVSEMIAEGMNKFLRIHVMCFENYKEVPVHFIGSVAYFFSDQLRLEADKLGITIGNITKKPIDGLVDYHIKYHFDKLDK
jgi:N-acetylglucosamine kinase-like BadF-type ATPase